MPRRRLDTNDVRVAWERNAADWIGWARDPAEFDGHYVRYHRDLFLELVPAPGRRTLDVGCGEGRLSRDLAARGHDVVGVDASPTMVAAARDAAPEMEIHLADAANLPFEDASFDVVVAFMSFQDVEDLAGGVHEAMRVLEPGGLFCLAIVHPLNSAGEFAVPGVADAPFTIDGSYLEESFYVDALERDGKVLNLESIHRPLGAYTASLTGAGFLIDELREVALPEFADRGSHSPRWRRIPLFLHLRALKHAP